MKPHFHWLVNRNTSGARSLLPGRSWIVPPALMYGAVSASRWRFSPHIFRSRASPPGLPCRRQRRLKTASKYNVDIRLDAGHLATGGKNNFWQQLPSRMSSTPRLKRNTWLPSWVSTWGSGTWREETNPYSWISQHCSMPPVAARITALTTFITTTKK